MTRKGRSRSQPTSANAGFLPDTEVEFVIDGETVKIIRAEGWDVTRPEPSSACAAERVSQMTTDEILALTCQP